MLFWSEGSERVTAKKMRTQERWLVIAPAMTDDRQPKFVRPIHRPLDRLRSARKSSPAPPTPAATEDKLPSRRLKNAR